jgi:hypothetical protein
MTGALFSPSAETADETLLPWGLNRFANWRFTARKATSGTALDLRQCATAAPRRRSRAAAEGAFAMEASDWPTWWGYLAPVLMLALMTVCMVSIRCISGLRRNRAAEARGTDPAPGGPHVPARFPDVQSAWEEWRAAKPPGRDPE